MAKERKNPTSFNLEVPGPAFTSKRLEKQTYLMTFLDEFVAENQSKQYRHIVQVFTSDSISLMLNKLLGRKTEKIMRLSTAQISALHPYFALYKVVTTKEQQEIVLPLPFDTFTDPKQAERILTGQAQRGEGVGLKSFEWEDVGKNQAESGLTIKASMDLYFNTVNDIYKIRSSDQGFRASFADLLKFPGTNKAASVADDSKFQIKVKVGWSTPQENELFDQETIEQIRKTQIVIDLVRLLHDLDFSENGQITMRMNFVARIEAFLSSPESNILGQAGLTPEELKEISNELVGAAGKVIAPQITQLASGIERNKAAISRIEEERRQALRTAGQRSSGQFGVGSYVERERVRKDFDQQLATQKAIRQRNEEAMRKLQSALERAKDESRIRSMPSLILELERSGRLFFADLDQNAVRLFFDAEQIARDQRNISQTSEAVANRIEAFRRGAVESNRQEIQRSLRRNSLPGATDQTEKLRREVEKKLNGVRPSNLTAEAKEPKKTEDTRIYYTFLGDLVDAALNILDKQTAGRGETGLSSFNKQGFRLLLGPVEVFDPRKRKTTNVNLADIPVDFDLFQEWFVEHVVRTGREVFPCRQFIVDLIKTFVPASLNQTSSRDSKLVAKRSVNRIGSVVFSSRDPKNLFAKGSKVNVDRQKFAFNTDYANPDGNTEFMAIFAYSNIAPTNDGDFDKDAAVGVPHFYLGAERGLLKKVKFSKKDIPYRAESVLSKQDEYSRNYIFFPEVYNADMKMVGNALFRNGMTVYIDPRSTGFLTERQGTSRDYEDFQALPIGGYYVINSTRHRIQPGRFVTELSLRYSSPSPYSTIGTKPVATSANTNPREALEEPSIEDRQLSIRRDHAARAEQKIAVRRGR